jgi:hypothetical protein
MLGGGTRGAAEFGPHVPLLARNFRVIRVQTLNIARAQDRLPLPQGYSVKLESRALADSRDRLDESSRRYSHGLPSLACRGLPDEH